jgi:nucleoside-triphosphatase
MNLRDLVVTRVKAKDNGKSFLCVRNDSRVVERWISLGACTELNSMSLKKNILVTGLPGIGKTTLIKDLSFELKHYHPSGFYTEELREGGVRMGFELVTLNGERMVLSHKNIVAPYRVGKYKVDVGAFEKFLVKEKFFEPEIGLIVIDEIGKMECLSNKFRQIMEAILDSEKIVVATIALKAGGFIGGLRKREDVKLFEMTKVNRDSLLLSILDEVKALLP